MSYSQILRRINRLLKASVNDFMDSISKDEQELQDFDAELRGERATRDAGGGDAGGSGQGGQGSGNRAAGGQSRAGGGYGGTGARGGSGSRQSQGGQSQGGQSQGGQTGQHKEGRRKPGERDDAFYFGILGITPNASEAEIKKAYRDLMRQYHPDRVATLGPELQETAAKRAKEINEAYHIIERRRGFK